MFHQISIIGLGLIGSSIARDVRAHQLAEVIIGVDPDAESLQLLRREDIIDHGSSVVDNRIKNSDLIIIAGPPSSFEKIAHAIKPYLAAGTIISDVGSIKQYAIATISPYLPDPTHFVPVHPIAGSEQSGAAAGRKELFQGKRIIMATNEFTAPVAKEKVAVFWQALGGVVGEMDAATHDIIYAHVSHLTQIMAYALMLTLEPYVTNTKSFPFLRLAGSNPALWVDICFGNRDAVLSALQVAAGITQHFISEFQSGEDAGHTSTISEDAAVRLFPRIVASTLISTVQNAELKHGKRMAPFVGTGFADMTAIALEPPEVDIEKISESYRQVAILLKSFLESLNAMALALEAKDQDRLQAMFTDAQKIYLAK
ncbi:MAG: prephenate dehydrogenase/arogenate dehydrogenase family protein [Rickettsiales bacterium]